MVSKAIRDIPKPPRGYPVSLGKPYVNHFAAGELQSHCKIALRHGVGSICFGGPIAVLSGAAERLNSEMEDFQEPKFRSQSNSCWRKKHSATTSYRMGLLIASLSPSTNRVRT